MRGEHRPLPARPDGAGVLGLAPGLPAGHQLQPRGGVGLHHVGRRAAGVARPLDALHGAVRRDADLHRTARGALRELLEREPDRRGERRPGGGGGVGTPGLQGLPSLADRDTAAGWHGAHGATDARHTRQREWRPPLSRLASTRGMDNIWHLTKRLHVDLRRQASCV